ncbi:hypothetical protein [Streptomyces violascens]|uniref:DUF2007 domain-containing protein n=1 Tax=Streptomyces violascens TaxID=67381 RepID=A0ABQ3QXD2_9ACTN|nr:hypothetical protein [Streptomyces violascens]GGU13425.1 hypothetical protein GCM10010289_38900 [Streptomyces violascens]GHI41940.1 hypothetical protein Sviol_63480 [Streptomyces violascens]
MAKKNSTIDPCAATEQLRAALTRAGIVLPSLGLDDGGSLGLINLGRVRADVAIRLAVRLDKGHDASLVSDAAL